MFPSMKRSLLAIVKKYNARYWIKLRCLANNMKLALITTTKKKTKLFYQNILLVLSYTAETWTLRTKKNIQTMEQNSMKNNGTKNAGNIIK